MLLNEIFKGKWALLPEIAEAYKPNILNLLNGRKFADGIPNLKKAGISAIEIPARNPLLAGEKIGVVEISGTMTKSGGLCNEGASDIAEHISEIEKNDFIGGILHIDSPGGSTSAVGPLIEALQKTKKTWIAYVDDMAASAAYMIATYADEIWAATRMAEVGSIGVMAMLINDKERLKQEGVEIIKVYPPESDFKQKSINEALDGNTKLLIEELRPWAQYFQDTVKKNRKKLDMSVEGLLNGKMFYAFDAVQNGLVDKIGSLDDVVNRILIKSKKPI